MKGFYRLLNYEFSTMLRAVLLLCLGTLISPLLFLNTAIRDLSIYSVHERFEDLYVSSGCVIVFLIYLATLFAFFVKSVYANYWGSKSIYTLLTLPVRREAVYFSKLLAFAIGLAILLAVQILSVWLGYGWVASKLKHLNEGQFLMANGLFLAFIRSEFLRILLPMNISGLLSSASLWITVLTGIYYAVLCERSKRYWGYVPVAVAIMVLIYVITHRLAPPTYYGVHHDLYLPSVLLLALSGFFMWHSIRLIQKGAIA
nr:hypothetical protein [Aneurinibacillus sp. XH2]